MFCHLALTLTHIGRCCHGAEGTQGRQRERCPPQQRPASSEAPGGLQLNGLAHEFGLEPIPQKAPCGTVEKLVRSFDRQDLGYTFALQLREAAELYASNGGHFGVQLGPIIEPATTGALAQLQRHRVLQDGFILKSKAFMLTYNSRSFTPRNLFGILALDQGQSS